DDINVDNMEADNINYNDDVDEVDEAENLNVDTRYFSFGRHLDELHVTWDHLEKKRTRLRTNTKTLEDLCSQSLETASQAIHDAVAPHQVTASQYLRRPPVTYPEEVENTLGTPIEVKPLDETPLEDLGLNTCNHDIPLSSKESPNFYEPEPQPQPLPSCPSLDINLGKERGLEPPIKPPSPDSFRIKEVDHLTNHTPPSPRVASFHLRDLYCYYRPCVDDPKKHYGFKPGLLGHSGSLGVDFSNMEMIEDDWELEPIEVSFLGRRHIDLESILMDLQLEVRRKRYSKSKLMFQNLQILFKVDFDLGSEGLRLSSFSRVVEFIKGAQGDHEAEVFQVSNDDTAVAERRLEHKQPKEKTNTNCLVKE
nr:hypothetical protein [Tanacetum cinerariifolium]